MIVSYILFYVRVSRKIILIKLLSKLNLDFSLYGCKGVLLQPQSEIQQKMTGMEPTENSTS